METHVFIAHIGYLTSIVLFIMGMKGLSKVRTAPRANRIAALGMLVAVVSQCVEIGSIDYTTILIGLAIGSVIGTVFALKVEMTALPQMVAIFNGFGGAASALVALSLFVAAERSGSLLQVFGPSVAGVSIALTLLVSVIVGSVTLSGSTVAYLKLSDRFGSIFGKPIRFSGFSVVLLLVGACLLGSSTLWLMYVPEILNATSLALITTLLALVIGVLVVLPIGGADMPVVVSLLNSYSGVAASATGFAIGSPVLIVAGALVGAAGLILTQVMCKAMNRSLLHVLVGGFGQQTAAGSSASSEYDHVKQADVAEAALDFDSARQVIIVPGYGLAVAQGQHAVGKLASALKANGCKVRFAIHPVAGRMPGHMNVLLAESQIPYDDLVEMSDINSEFQSTDLVLVVGANDVVNPAAKLDSNSPIYGMPILNVDEAKQVYVIKRSLSPGFAGIKNSLFEMSNCHMIYGDAKQVLEELNTELSEAA